MSNELFNAGLAFRQAIQSRQIPPHQFGALLQDICTDQPGLKPALLDLSARQVFREIMLHQPTTQKALAKDRLLSEIRPLYRDEIVSQLTAFIDGALDLNTIDHVASGSQTINERSLHKPRQQGVAGLTSGSFYADNPSRLLLLSVLSFGIYTFLWSYRHWRHYKRVAATSQSLPALRKNDASILPFWSASFGGFYIIGASRRIRLRLNELGFDSDEPRPWLVFILFSLVPSLINLLQASESVSTNIVLLAVSISIIIVAYMQPARLQELANKVLQQESGVRPQFRTLNAWDWLFVISGGIFSVLYIIGMLVPPSWLES
ncbi:hypothetical protein KBY83_15015 [Cyanobium sp. WKJ7-Wakatipu]|uniref:hypothetical protein n=1 Tax=Cyanobium sp. WKJ7-Wakatipu TaxID=2823726 RepID=UPI0020CE14D7|nr:hypothetical protein [Cyanobium sp. WKJ7-Wakatipu]MCP9784602.1 hypothetical protein [Cyanobium sp. WKJ7-Wakatipu]